MTPPSDGSSDDDLQGELQAAKEENMFPVFPNKGWTSSRPLPSLLENLATNLAGVAGDCSLLNALDQAAIHRHRPIDIQLMIVRARYIYEKWKEWWSVRQRTGILEIPKWNSPDWTCKKLKTSRLACALPKTRTIKEFERKILDIETVEMSDKTLPSKYLDTWRKRQGEFLGLPVLSKGETYWCNERQEVMVHCTTLDRSRIVPANLLAPVFWSVQSPAQLLYRSSSAHQEFVDQLANAPTCATPIVEHHVFLISQRLKALKQLPRRPQGLLWPLVWTPKFLVPDDA